MKPKVLFVQPNVNPPGGGNGVAAWMLEWLVPRYQVTLLSMAPFDAQLTDSYYGTSLAGQPIENVLYGRRLLPLLRNLRLPIQLLGLHLMMRGARQFAQGPFDLVCSAFDEQDFGRPCIEYVHYPWNVYPRPDAPPNWNDSLALQWVLKAYNWFCRQVSGFRTKNRPANLTLVNSDWTGRLVQKVYPGNPYQVLHPPALAETIDDDRSRRQPRFLSIGRVAPSKEWLKLIEIVAELRRMGHPVGLTLAGSRDCRVYEQVIRDRMAQEKESWIQLITDFTRAELSELMLSHEYGLHGMTDEHYGMAVAELLLGGCLTMVPNDGGQVEIVTDPRLRYDSVADAVGKWNRVLTDPQLKAQLLADQLGSRARLTKERFLQEFETIVLRCLEAGVERAREAASIPTARVPADA
jgi:glycosyltransferase involved in cell wall biosynthesis